MQFDAFISHAWEDKDDFVRELAERLQKQRIEVWYDEFSLKVGDSLRRSIDFGLTKSRFGIVVLSKNFFEKHWTNWELDGLVQRQNNSDYNLIIPIWHKIDKKEILEYSPSLADKIAIKSERGIDNVIKQIDSIINPKGSTLIIARDRLIEFEFYPPVITDDWWLDIIAYSGSNPHEGTFQESTGWGRWGFPLPEKNDTPKDRGERLAWSAMQKTWQDNADKLNISQLTEPKEVRDFIYSQPGLYETCLEFPHFLATYAPQLTIPTLGGQFEESFEKWYQNSLIENSKRKEQKDIGAIGLSTNKQVPLCDEPIALRDKNFGYYQASNIACFFVQGRLMGPPVRFYDYCDYAFWFLSSISDWVPKKTHKYLLTGIKQWAVWHWDVFKNNNQSDFQNNASSGALANALYKARTPTTFKLTKKIETDIKTRIAHTKNVLNLPESIDQLFGKFIAEKFIDEWIITNNRRSSRRK